MRWGRIRVAPPKIQYITDANVDDHLRGHSEMPSDPEKVDNIYKEEDEEAYSESRLLGGGYIIAHLGQCCSDILHPASDKISPRSRLSLLSRIIKAIKKIVVHRVNGKKNLL